MNKEFLKTCSIPELIKLQYDLRRFPEDKQHWLDVMEELKNKLRRV